MEAYFGLFEAISVTRNSIDLCDNLFVFWKMLAIAWESDFVNALFIISDIQRFYRLLILSNLILMLSCPDSVNGFN